MGILTLGTTDIIITQIIYWNNVVSNVVTTDNTGRILLKN